MVNICTLFNIKNYHNVEMELGI